ncbi:MAG TPA: ribonucleotide-diphosphate reductase subunit beta [Jatrophihabitans sp.]|nr:ribonucleotide-diphosphate reductase subunit beta [Jatrophihabitans sp.]
MTEQLQAEPGFVPDITDAEPVKLAKLATSADLYSRWERQQWLVAQVNPARDLPVWSALRPFFKDQMLAALAELEVGEVTVTQTLGSLVDNPPTEDDRIYLCTQLADEARHVKFFQTYLADVCAADAGAQGAELEVSPDYRARFTPVLTEATDRVRAAGSTPADWYRAMVYYHLVTEGMLAATALRTTRYLARRLELTALDEGLTNVTRDESRHVAFGLRAAQDGVAAGHGTVISDAHFESLPAAAWVLIGPSRFSPVPKIRMAADARRRQLQEHVDIAEDRLVKQLRLIGLPQLCDAARIAWQDAVGAALDGYEQRWDAPHPLRTGGS